MEFLKVLFESGALTWEQFTTAVAEKGFNIADLATGNYVDKRKYETLESTNQTLTKDIKTRDTDIAKLKKQLEEAGTDGEKLTQALAEIEKLQGDYKTAQDTHKKELDAAKYEYAVKDFANSQKFTSEAAKRDFIRAMTDKGLKMENDAILGASDFLDAYKTDNADSFAEDGDKPHFSKPTKPAPSGEVTKEQFAKMGYKARMELFTSNKALYDKLSEE